MEKKASSAEYMKIRRFVLNRIHRANGKMIQLPTAQELAKQFGCSRPTVCKAMKMLTEDGYVIGKPGLGSFTNPQKVGIGKGSNMDGLPIIGIVFGDGMLVHYDIFFGEVLSQVLAQVIRMPAILHIINLTSGDPGKVAEEILAEDLDALLWETAAGISGETIPLLRKAGLPVIVMGSVPFPESDGVFFDMDTLGREIAELLIREKRRHIVYLADRDPWNKSRHMLLKTYAEAGIPLNEKLFLGGCEEGLVRLREFLELGVPVDAVVNPLFFTKKVLEIFDEVGANRETACTLVNNGIYQEDIPVPGGITYQLPVREYTESAIDLLKRLLKDKNHPLEQIPVHIPVSKNS